MQNLKARTKTKKNLKRKLKTRHKVDTRSRGNPKQDKDMRTFKQSKIKDLFQQMDTASKSPFFSSSPLVTSVNNSSFSLDWDVEDCLSVENEALTGERGEDIVNTKSNLKGDMDLAAENCLLTAQTVIAIYDQLSEANQKIDELKSLMRNYISKIDKKTNSISQAAKITPSPQMVQAARKLSVGKDMEERLVLQRHRILLQVADIPLNMARWHSRRVILNSLSQLLHCRVQSNELKEISWLPSRYGFKRILLTFEQIILPTMLFRLENFLSKYHIRPVHVFYNTQTQSLLQSGRRAKSVREDDINLENPKCNCSLAIKQRIPPPTKTEQDKDNGKKFPDLSNGKIQFLDDEEELIHQFATLPLGEQQLILNKIEIVRSMMKSVTNATDTLNSLLPSNCSSMKLLLSPVSESTKSPSKKKRKRASAKQKYTKKRDTQQENTTQVLNNHSEDKSVAGDLISMSLENQIEHSQDLLYLIDPSGDPNPESTQKSDAPSTSCHFIPTQANSIKGNSEMERFLDNSYQHDVSHIQAQQLVKERIGQSSLPSAELLASDQNLWNTGPQDKVEPSPQFMLRKAEYHNSCVYMGSIDDITPVPEIRVQSMQIIEEAAISTLQTDADLRSVKCVPSERDTQEQIQNLLVTSQSLVEAQLPITGSIGHQHDFTPLAHQKQAL